jgi:hypothetical protein
MNSQHPTVLDPFAAQRAAAYGPPPAGLPVQPPLGGYGAPPAPPAPRKRRTGLVVGGIAGAVVVLGGLGVGALALFGPSTLVTADVESEIVRITQEQAGVPAQGVDCPEDIAVEAGSSVTCTATVDGQPVTFTVTQDDDEGNLTITHARLLPALEVEDAVSAQLSADVGEDVVAVCSAEGQTVIVNDPGTTIPCTAVNVADTTLQAEILVSVDGEGTVAYEFA